MDKKRLASKILSVGKNRIKFVNNHEDIDQAITREDVKRLIVKGDIIVTKKVGVSRGRARFVAAQKKKGRRKGPGSKEGKKKARTPKKREWMNKVRKQRGFLTLLKEKNLIQPSDRKKVYKMIKGGFFRNKKHLKTFVNEKEMIKNGKK